jgi:hypothetical protein
LARAKTRGATVLAYAAWIDRLKKQRALDFYFEFEFEF